MDDIATSDKENEGVPRYRSCFGREVKHVEHLDPIFANMCFLPPTNEAKTVEHNNKQAHFQHLAGGNEDHKVKCRERNNQFLHQIDWDPSTFLSGN